MNYTEFDKLFKPLANTKPMAVSGSCRKALKKTVFKANFWSFNLYNFNIIYSLLIVGVISTSSVVVINKIIPNKEAQITIIQEPSEEVEENIVELDSAELQNDNISEIENNGNFSIEQDNNSEEINQNTQAQIEYIYITDSVIIEEHQIIYDTIR